MKRNFDTPKYHAHLFLLFFQTISINNCEVVNVRFFYTNRCKNTIIIVHSWLLNNQQKKWYKRNRLKQVSVYSISLYAYVTLIYAKKKFVIKIIITHNRKAWDTTLFNEKCCTNRQRYFFLSFFQVRFQYRH